jgi:hypothetical protein
VSGLNLQFDPDALRPLIRAVAEEVLAAVAEDHAQFNGRLAYSESEAAALLGLQAHQLRDERLRGRIRASVGPGKRILYSRDDLLEYLRQRRWTKNGDK